MKEQEKMIDHMVRLSFEDAGRISLLFNTELIAFFNKLKSIPL
jgi:hypothetical protein